MKVRVRWLLSATRIAARDFIQRITNDIVTCSAEYLNDGTVVPKGLGKGVSAVTVQQVASQRSSAHAANNMEIPWSLV
jgi:hypothetical protein